MISSACKKLRKIFLFFLILLFFSCSQKKVDDSSNISGEDFYDSEFEGFYVPDFDDGNWVQQIVNETQEELAAEEIQNLLEIQSIIQSPFSVNQNEVEFVEKRLSDSNRRLKIMEYGNEIFIPVEKQNSLVFINKSNSYLVRDFYNKDYQLTKKEIWNGEKPGDEKLLFTQEYLYGNNNKPVFQTTKYEDKTVEITWQYDEKNRITYEKETVIEKDKRTSKAQLYKYNQNDEIPPDYEYYENDEVQLITKYVTKTTYSTQIYFEDDFSVKTYYENGNKVREQYIQSGEVVREREY